MAYCSRGVSEGVKEKRNKEKEKKRKKKKEKIVLILKTLQLSSLSDTVPCPGYEGKVE